MVSVFFSRQGAALQSSLCVTLILLAGVVYAQPVNDADAFLKKQMKELHIPGMQVAVVQNGTTIFLKTYGFSYLPDSVKATNRSMFPINSCTKAFTGVAIMQLVEAGKLDLDAPVSRYLDDLPAAWQMVTLRQLLTHVSGIPDLLRVLNPATHNVIQGDDEETIWAKVKAMPMDFTPGEQFSYNQTNYALLAKIITKYSGKPFEAVFRDQQFAPAGMTRTTFADSRSVLPGITQSYSYTRRVDGTLLDEPVFVQNYVEFPAFHHAASGMVSTAEDLARWIIALQRCTLLKTPAALNALWAAGTYTNGQRTQWAAGWMTRPRVQHPAVIATGGGRSAFCVYPDDDFAVVILTNLAGSSPEDFIDELVSYFHPAIAKSDPLTALRMQLDKEGFNKAIAIVKNFRKANALYTVPESELNDWGYRLMSKGRLKEAIAIFELVIWLYPDSWNAYDSYAEGLMKNGQKKEAITMYQKSIALYPGNTNGKRILEHLLKG